MRYVARITSIIICHLTKLRKAKFSILCDVMSGEAAGENWQPVYTCDFDAISDAISRTKRDLPYPARMSFSRSIVWMGKKVMTYYLKTPLFPIHANLAVLRRSVTQNRIEIA